MIIGPTSSGPFPKPNLKGRKILALLTRCERTSWVSVSVCMSLVCLKSKCGECVCGYKVTMVVVAKVTLQLGKIGRK